MSSATERGPALAVRLRRSAAGRLFRVFFVFDLVLLCILCWTFLWHVEYRAVETRAALRASQDTPVVPADAVYIENVSAPGGFILMPWVENLMPGGGAVRVFVRPTAHGSIALSASFFSGYGMYDPSAGDYIQFPIAREQELIRITMTALIFFQLIQLMWFSMSCQSAFERRLWPFKAMVHDAENVLKDPLHARLPLYGPSPEPVSLAKRVNQVLDSAADIHRSYGQQSRFVSDASHELRTPIAVIQGYANMLDRWGKDDPGTLDEAIQALKNEADGMQQLVEQLLFLSRGDNGKIALQCKPLDVSILISETFQEAMMIDDAHKYVQDTEGPLMIMADAGLLKQALRALVDNSRKYTAGGGTISLACRQEDGRARLSVEDTGVGIDLQDVPRIFDRFFRADPSRARKTGGSGLGLSIAKWIVDRHQGTIEVLSRVGVGTRVTFVLPLQNMGPDKV